MERRFIGIDLGGTSMKIGVVDAEGRVQSDMEEPTPSDPMQAIDKMVQVSTALIGQADMTWEQVAGIGIGLPGFLDIPGGKILELTNLNWKDIPIKALLEKRLEKPVRIDNDANVAALGEAWCGAGRGVTDLICVTLGTGVGGGVIVGGGLVYGLNGFAGEIGHIQIDTAGHRCNCGQIGCLETISSAIGMMRQAEEMIAQGVPTHLPQQPTVNEIFQAARVADPVATRVIQLAIQSLARAFAQLSVILNPTRFVVGGGISRAGDDLFVPLREAYQTEALAHVSKGVEIIPAMLGNQAGFIGAAGLVARGNN